MENTSINVMLIVAAICVIYLIIMKRSSINVNNHIEEFNKSYFKIRILSIFLFICIVVFLQIYYDSIKKSLEEYSNMANLKELILYSSLSSILSAFLVLYIMRSRGNSIFSNNKWMMLIFVILSSFIFSIIQELCGINKCLSEVEFKNINKIQYVMLCILILIFVYYASMMLISSYEGYYDGKYDILNTTFKNPITGNVISSNTGIVLEILVILIVILVPQIINMINKKNKITNVRIFILVISVIISILLHFMFHYNNNI